MILANDLFINKQMMRYVIKYWYRYRYRDLLINLILDQACRAAFSKLHD